jgi:phosphate-selective porin OprO and OprP
MLKKLVHLIIATINILAFFLVQPVYSEENAPVEQRIQNLQQQLNVLKRQYEIDREDSTSKAKSAPVVIVSTKDGASLKAADNSYKLKLSGYAQADARLFKDDAPALKTTDTFLLRTVRLTFSGSFSDLGEFNISPEFAGTSVNLPDAYIDLKFTPAIKLRGGKFKTPFGLERLQATNTLTFVELALPGNLTPNRDVGFQLFGDVLGETVSYNIGIFNGLQDGATSITDSNKEKDLSARIFIQPLKNTDALSLRGLGFGVAATRGKRKDANVDLVKYKTTGQATFFSYISTVTTDGVTTLDVTADGLQTRFSPQLYYYYKSFGLLGEYINSEAEFLKTTETEVTRSKFKNTGWQVAASYVLTGDDTSYKSVTPQNPFSIKDKEWGALELAARYATLDIDDNVFTSSFANISKSASKACALTVGFNWHLTRNIRYTLDYGKTRFEGGAANGADRPAENLIVSRIQVQF